MPELPALTGLLVKRPKKRLIKTNAENREMFVQEHVILRSDAQTRKAKVFFVDEAHICTDVELRCQSVLRGKPALVDSSSLRWARKLSTNSAV